MPEQNKVLFNLPQNKTDAEKQQARENIGVEHNVKFISNTSSPVPTLAQVQAMLDAGDYVVLMYDDGNNATPDIPMTVIQDFRGGTPSVTFTSVNGSGAVTISLTGSGFGAPTIDLFAEGKLQVFTIPNGTLSIAGLYVAITAAMNVGKTPLIKYEETTSPSQYGYYTLISVGTNAYSFMRCSGQQVSVLNVFNTDGITFNRFPILHIYDVAPQFSSLEDYGPNRLTINGNKLYRSKVTIAPGAWASGDWHETTIDHELGRVRNAENEAVNHAPTFPYKWTVPNNAWCSISYAETVGTPTLTLEVDIADDEVPNFVVEMMAPNGGVLTVNINRYDADSHTLTGTTVAYCSKSAGDELPVANKIQITCVGNCWTWEEYVNPNLLRGNSKGDQAELTNDKTDKTDKQKVMGNDSQPTRK